MGDQRGSSHCNVANGRGLFSCHGWDDRSDSIYHRFNWQLTPGYGWDGVMVAIIGRNHPIFIIFASLFLAYLELEAKY